jgi:toxin ParE1/3/4
MTLEFHPAVQRDFNEAAAHYEAAGGPHLADRFETEVRACLAAIRAGPGRFPFYQGSAVFRRVRLRDFPYVLVYRAKPDVVRVTLLRHEKRHPRFGGGRW